MRQTEIFEHLQLILRIAKCEIESRLEEESLNLSGKEQSAIEEGVVGDKEGGKPDQHSQAAKQATSSQQTATSCCSSSPKPKPKTGPKPKPKSESRQMLSCCCCCCDFNIFIINDKYFDSHNNWHVIEAGLGCCLRVGNSRLRLATRDSAGCELVRSARLSAPKLAKKLAIFSFILACLRRTLAFSLGCFVLLASTWRPLCSEQMILIKA